MTCLWEANAQDHMLSQYHSMLSSVNPAYTGLSPGMHMQFNFRNQWTNLPEDYKTYNFIIDVAERDIPGSGGLGLVFMNDQQANSLINQFRLGLMASVRIQLSENALTQFGLSGSFVQKSFNWDHLVFGDQLDNIYGNIYNTSFMYPESNTKIYPDLDAGILFQYHSSRFSRNKVVSTFGLSVQHVTKPDESFFADRSRLPRKITFSGDVLFLNQDYFKNEKRGVFNSEVLKIDPGFMFQNQGEFNSFSVGINTYKYNIYLGTWYRLEQIDNHEGDALIFLGGLTINLSDNMQMKFIYSYDFIISEMNTTTGPSHEISLKFEFDNISLFTSKEVLPSYSKRSNKYLECPSF